MYSRASRLSCPYYVISLPESLASLSPSSKSNILAARREAQTSFILQLSWSASFVPQYVTRALKASGGQLLCF
ncbi:hypothetical protein KC19_VG112300 [Ceratodon purpureus]|uniref:Uncharacterized protein n=1 Tax=Ceratodon purpureus TaxID=3225 RepID=A0A8T0HPV7_CERPU|nr:hypothetical protein KC19_VG112300 [Ceratodon purpureus]